MFRGCTSRACLLVQPPGRAFRVRQFPSTIPQLHVLGSLPQCSTALASCQLRKPRIASFITTTVAHQAVSGDFRQPELRVPLALQAIYHEPMRREPMYGLPVCDLKLRSYSIRQIEFQADFALRAAYYLNLPASVNPLPRRIERWTVPRSNFVHKKSQENFERITYSRLIQIKDGSSETVELWLAFIKKHAVHGVGMKANVWGFEEIGIGKRMNVSLETLRDVPRPKFAHFGPRKSVETAAMVKQILESDTYRERPFPLYPEDAQPGTDIPKAFTPQPQHRGEQWPAVDTFKEETRQAEAELTRKEQQFQGIETELTREEQQFQDIEAEVAAQRAQQEVALKQQVPIDEDVVRQRRNLETDAKVLQVEMEGRAEQSHVIDTVRAKQVKAGQVDSEAVSAEKRAQEELQRELRRQMEEMQRELEAARERERQREMEIEAMRQKEKERLEALQKEEENRLRARRQEEEEKLRKEKEQMREDIMQQMRLEFQKMMMMGFGPATAAQQPPASIPFAAPQPQEAAAPAVSTPAPTAQQPPAPAPHTASQPQVTTEPVVSTPPPSATSEQFAAEAISETESNSRSTAKSTSPQPVEAATVAAVPTSPSDASKANIEEVASTETELSVAPESTPQARTEPAVKKFATEAAGNAAVKTAVVDGQPVAESDTVDPVPPVDASTVLESVQTVTAEATKPTTEIASSTNSIIESASQAVESELASSVETQGADLVAEAQLDTTTAASGEGSQKLESLTTAMVSETTTAGVAEQTTFPETTKAPTEESPSPEQPATHPSKPAEEAPLQKPAGPVESPSMPEEVLRQPELTKDEIPAPHKEEKPEVVTEDEPSGPHPKEK